MPACKIGVILAPGRLGHLPRDGGHEGQAHAAGDHHQEGQEGH